MRLATAMMATLLAGFQCLAVCSGNPYVLSALITKKTGQSAFDFAKKELFEPLGITIARWGQVDAQGVTDGEAGLSLSPPDMARIGYLYLHNGMWDGKQIIPSSWVDRAKEGKVQATFGFHYANLWWSLPEKGAYMALGRHSQIAVVPAVIAVCILVGLLAYRVVERPLVSALLQTLGPTPTSVRSNTSER